MRKRLKIILPVVLSACALLACSVFGPSAPPLANVAHDGCVSDPAAYAPVQVLFSACDHPGLGALTPDYSGAIVILYARPRFVLVNFTTGAQREIPLVSYANAHPDLQIQFADVDWRFITPTLVLLREGYSSKTSANYLLYDTSSNSFTLLQLGPTVYAYTGDFSASLNAARAVFQETDSVFYLPPRTGQSEFDLVLFLLRPDAGGNRRGWLFGMNQEATEVRDAATAAGLKVSSPVTYMPPPSPQVTIPGGTPDPSLGSPSTVSADGQYFADYRGIGRVSNGEWVVKTGWAAEGAGLYPILFVGDGKVLLIGNGRFVCPTTLTFDCPVQETPTPILIWREP